MVGQEKCWSELTLEEQLQVTARLDAEHKAKQDKKRAEKVRRKLASPSGQGEMIYKGMAPRGQGFVAMSQPDQDDRPE